MLWLTAKVTLLFHYFQGLAEQESQESESVSPDMMHRYGTIFDNFSFHMRIHTAHGILEWLFFVHL